MTKLPIREEDVQRTIMEGLRLLGCTVLQTSHRVKLSRCPKCAASYRPSGAYGASQGVPDLLVSRKVWPVGAWLGLEVKGPTTALSPHQKDLLLTGRIVIVRSWEDARSAVEWFEHRLRTWPSDVAP